MLRIKCEMVSNQQIWFPMDKGGFRWTNTALQGLDIQGFVSVVSEQMSDSSGEPMGKSVFPLDKYLSNTHLTSKVA